MEKKQKWPFLPKMVLIAPLLEGWSEGRFRVDHGEAAEEAPLGPEDGLAPGGGFSSFLTATIFWQSAGCISQ